MFLRNPATILWTRTASTEVHTCSHMENSSHSRISFSLLDEEFRGTASLVCWEPFFILVQKLRRDSQNNWNISQIFGLHGLLFWLLLPGWPGERRSVIFPLPRVGNFRGGQYRGNPARLSRGSEDGNFLTTHLGNSRATHLGPPTIQRDLPQNVHQLTTLGYLVLPMIHQQPTYFWKQFSSDLGPGSF